jgi:hypothetical protein
MLVTSYNTTHYTLPQFRRLLKNDGIILLYYTLHPAITEKAAQKSW